MGKRKMSQDTKLQGIHFSWTIKSHIFSTSSLAAIFFIIYADILISNLSVYPADTKCSDIFKEEQTPNEIF